MTVSAAAPAASSTFAITVVGGGEMGEEEEEEELLAVSCCWGRLRARSDVGGGNDTILNRGSRPSRSGGVSKG